MCAVTSFCLPSIESDKLKCCLPYAKHMGAGIMRSHCIYFFHACTTFGLLGFLLRVFSISRVTWACPVTTDLIMRVNVRTTTTGEIKTMQFSSTLDSLMACQASCIFVSLQTMLSSLDIRSIVPCTTVHRRAMCTMYDSIRLPKLHIAYTMVHVDWRENVFRFITPWNVIHRVYMTHGYAHWHSHVIWNVCLFVSARNFAYFSELQYHRALCWFNLQDTARGSTIDSMYTRGEID